MKTEKPSLPAAAEPKPHYLGHRERLRERILESGGADLLDHEILEYLLCAAQPRGDVKPLAKTLIARFGSLGGVLAAPPGELGTVKGCGDSSIAVIKVAQEAARRLVRESAIKRPVLSSWQQVVDYCRASIGHERIEQFLLLFLDRKNRLIADERQQRGTVDHTPVYPREVVKRALDLQASAIVLVHNHPSGDPSPSRADIEMTRQILEAAEKLGITVHDHLIVTAAGHLSFKAQGLL
jgi:DNA repair protein RadC